MIATGYLIRTAILHPEKGGTILCELLDSKGTTMQSFNIFTCTENFI
jgi:hypothetical protein